MEDSQGANSDQLNRLALHHEQKQLQHQMLLQRVQAQEAELLNRCLQQKSPSSSALDLNVCLLVWASHRPI